MVKIEDFTVGENAFVFYPNKENGHFPSITQVGVKRIENNSVITDNDRETAYEECDGANYLVEQEIMPGNIEKSLLFQAESTAVCYMADYMRSLFRELGDSEEGKYVLERLEKLGKLL